MKLFKTIGLFTAILAVIVTIQGCDLTQTTPSNTVTNRNPYTEQVNKAFNGIADAVFTNIEKKLYARKKANSEGNLKRKDLLRYASEGYAQWAKENGVNQQAFRTGAQYTLLQQFSNKSKGRRSQASIKARTDSLLAEAGFTKIQRDYISQLPSIVESSGSIKVLKRQLRHFDRKVTAQLGEKNSKPVLKMSALVQGSMTFVASNAKTLALLVSLANKNNNQISFSYKSEQSSYNIPKLKSGCPECTNPPGYEDFHNNSEMIWQLIEGGSLGGGAGAALGSFVAPGGGTAIGYTVGFGVGFIGATVGALTGAELYNSAANEEYQEALEDWCEKPENEQHENYYELCY